LQPPAPALPVLRALAGLDAALEEYRDFEAAGMLDAWRERWACLLKYG